MSFRLGLMLECFLFSLLASKGPPSGAWLFTWTGRWLLASLGTPFSSSSQTIPVTPSKYLETLSNHTWQQKPNVCVCRMSLSVVLDCCVTKPRQSYCRADDSVGLWLETTGQPPGFKFQLSCLPCVLPGWVNFSTARKRKLTLLTVDECLRTA